MEEAPVKLLQPGHPLLETPNLIRPEDFDGWVQERGLYFPGEFDSHYETILEMNDPGEKPLKSGILYARVGRASISTRRWPGSASCPQASLARSSSSPIC